MMVAFFCFAPFPLCDCYKLASLLRFCFNFFISIIHTILSTAFSREPAELEKMQARSWAISAFRSCQCVNGLRIHHPRLPMGQSRTLRPSWPEQTHWHSILMTPMVGKAQYSAASALKIVELETPRIKKVLPKNASTATLIIYLAKRGAVHDALNHILKLFSSGIMPSQEVLYQYFMACSRAKDIGNAMKVYRLLINYLAQKELPLSRRLSKQVTYIFSVMINVVERNSNPVDISTIWRIYEDMQTLKIPMNTVLYNTLLKILLNRQDHTHVHSLYREMLDNGQKPSLYTYSMLMLSMAKQGDMTGFTKLLDVMQSRQMFPDFIGWCVIMNALGRHGNYEGVAKVYEYLQASNAPITSWIVNERLHALLCRKLNQSWTRTRRRKKIEQIWEEEFGVPVLNSVPPGYPGIKPDTVSYTIMMKALSFDVPHKAVEEIPQILSVMDDRGLVPGSEALIHYVAACVKSKNTVAAKEAIIRFKEQYNILANERMWRRVLGAMASRNDYNGISWALDALTGSNYVRRTSTIDYTIPRKRPSRYRNEIKDPDLKQLPPTTFLNNVFGPKTLALVFHALLRSDTLATGNRLLNHQSAELVISAWNRLYSAGVYIPLKTEQSIVIPGLLARGLQMQDVRERIIRH